VDHNPGDAEYNIVFPSLSFRMTEKKMHFSAMRLEMKIDYIKRVLRFEDAKG
jgi:hypothetical protein